MNPLDLAHFTTLLKQRAGIELTPDKDYLIRSRLQGIAATHGFESVEALMTALRTRPTEVLNEAVVDAMTTNETSFFRDQTPFDHLRRIVVEQSRKRTGAFRVWSAAASTGQEAYSIAMLWEEVAHLLPGVSLQIVATDLSNACLAKARSGLYSQFEVQRGLPIQKLIKHFEQVGPNWKVKPALAAMVEWRRHNLLDRADSLGKFDVVFCRNVLIYFDRPTRTRVLDWIARQLNPGGYLMLGASESVRGLTNDFEASTTAPGLYQKIDAAAPATLANPGLALRR